MLHVYEFFGDNPIIETLMLDGGRSTSLRSIRVGKPLFRQPFVEAIYADGKVELHQYAKEGFADSWAEAKLILTLLSDVEIRSDFNPRPLEREGQRRVEILRIRDQAIEASRKLFEQGRYAEVVEYYGPDCGCLPLEATNMLNRARQRLAENHA